MSTPKPAPPVPAPGTESLRVARLVKAHGLKGGLKLELYTDEPEKRFVPGAVFSLQVPETSQWRGLTIKLQELRWYNGSPVAFFEEAQDRTLAESLVKAVLWMDIPLEVEENAWYDYQLVGLKVIHEGQEIGLVMQVEHLPAQDLLVVKIGERDVLIPFVSEIVPEVDVEAGFITITPPGGLLEE
ncbi:MAG: ribosome maturation factor RimM [Microbacteriaceae bacterium]|nr:ribosome maturation factor RimM [Microbacteriaceae bacterium]